MEFGKPRGFGGVWRNAAVTAGEPSDLFQMFGFDKKVLHLQHTAAKAVTFDVQVDILGNGHRVSHKQIPVEAKGYAHHTFASDFTAHLVRVVADKGCTTTATFFHH